MKHLGLFLCLFFVINSLTQETSFAKTKKSQSKSKPTTKQSRIDTTHGPLTLLTLKQLGKLDDRARTRYFILLRQALVEMEYFQRAFGLRTALNTLPKDSKSMWALLLGSTANAQSQLFYRGYSSEVADTCIFAGHLQQYTSPPGGRGQCVRPRCPDSAQGPSSVQCSFITTGISDCVPGHEARHSTRYCVEQANRRLEQLGTGYRQQADSGYESFSSSTADQRQQTVDLLVRNAHDPWSMARIVKLTADHGTEILPTRYRPDFERFDRQTEQINEVFDSYSEHCSKELAPEVKEKIRQSGRADRKRALAALEQSGRKATVGNVIQADECRALLGDTSGGRQPASDDSRLGRLKNEFESIARSYPATEPNRPINLLEPQGGLSGGGPAPGSQNNLLIPQEQAQAGGASSQGGGDGQGGPLTPADSGDETHSTSCRYRDTLDYVASRAMSCVACVAEAEGSQGPEGSDYVEHGVSHKWLSFLTTMSYSCEGAGQGKSHDYMTVSKALEYVQTYGHCSAKNFEWNQKELSDDDKKLVRAWQLGRHQDKMQNSGFFSKMFKKDNFERIYGISYKDAKFIMCGSQRHDERYKGGAKNPRAKAQRGLSMVSQFHRLATDTNSANEDRIGQFSRADKLKKTGIGRCIQDIGKKMKAKALPRRGSNQMMCQKLEKAGSQEVSRSAHLARAGIPSIAVHERRGDVCFVSHTTTIRKNQGRVTDVETLFVEPRRYEGHRALASTQSGNRNLTYVTTASNNYCPDDRGRKDWYIPPNYSSSGSSGSGSRQDTTQ